MIYQHDATALARRMATMLARLAARPVLLLDLIKEESVDWHHGDPGLGRGKRMGESGQWGLAARGGACWHFVYWQPAPAENLPHAGHR